jgi:hypothetical protein
MAPVQSRAGKPARIPFTFQAEDLAERVLPPGSYTVQVSLVWNGVIQKTASEAVKVKFEVEEAGEFHRVAAWDNFVIHGPSEEGEAVARRRLGSLWKHAGLPAEPEVEVDLKDLEGCRVGVQTEVSTFRGVERTRIKSYHPANPAAAGEASGETPF